MWFLTVCGEQTSSSFQITITDSTLTPARTAQRPFDVEVSLGFLMEHFPSFVSTTAGILKQTPRTSYFWPVSTIFGCKFYVITSIWLMCCVKALCVQHDIRYR